VAAVHFVETVFRSVETESHFVDRIAAALEIETFELFTTSASPQAELKKLHKEILADLNRAVSEAVGKAIKEQCN